MHKTKAGERRKTLKRESLELVRDAKVLQKAAKTLPEARQEAQRLQEDADKALEESEVLKLQARLEDLTVWEMEKTKSNKKGTKTYTYWMVSWREGEKVRNVHLGSSRKMDAEAAKQKARKMKAEALGWSQ
jgi:regulator of replication initiation timing